MTSTEFAAYRRGRVDAGREMREEAAQLVEKMSGTFLAHNPKAHAYMTELVRRIRYLPIQETE